MSAQNNKHKFSWRLLQFLDVRQLCDFVVCSLVWHSRRGARTEPPDASAGGSAGSDSVTNGEVCWHKRVTHKDLLIASLIRLHSCNQFLFMAKKALCGDSHMITPELQYHWMKQCNLKLCKEGDQDPSFHPFVFIVIFIVIIFTSLGTAQPAWIRNVVLSKNIKNNIQKVYKAFCYRGKLMCVFSIVASTRLLCQDW